MGAAATAASAAVATAQPAVPPPLTTECLKVEANDRDDGQASTSGRQAAESSSSIGRALSVLRANGVVAVPTETVYGLAANALSADAVTGIFAAKGRPSDNPLIVHVSSLEMLASLYPPGWLLPHVYEAAVAAFWPGPLTILLPRSELVADAVTAGLPTMAVRMPAHPVALRLIEACGFPLAAPSANSSGRPSPTQAAHVVSDLGGRIPLVLDGGPCGCGVESTVLDALRSPPAVLRPGGVMFEQLVHLEGLHDLQVYRRDFVDEQLEQAPTTPGMKYRCGGGGAGGEKGGRGGCVPLGGRGVRGGGGGGGGGRARQGFQCRAHTVPGPACPAGGGVGAPAAEAAALGDPPLSPTPSSALASPPSHPPLRGTLTSVLPLPPALQALQPCGPGGASGPWGRAGPG